VDYDAVEIADVYDEARTLVPGVLDQWLNLITTHAAAGSCARILDVGCGTGRFSDALAARFGARVVAIDPSQKMLNVAHEKLAGRDVTFLRARAESLPLAGGAIDIAYHATMLPLLLLTLVALLRKADHL